MKIHVKYMVSHRCVLVVKYVLDEMKIPYLSVALGVIEMQDELSDDKKEELTKQLLELGLGVMDNKKAILIESIKAAIIELVHNTDDQLKVNLSTYLSDKLHYNYTYLANLFSEVEGMTIEHFLIIHKIERVKELIHDNELNLTEISYLVLQQCEKAFEAYQTAESNFEAAMEKGKYSEAGKALHTMQDFYSHSNFADLYGEYAKENKIELTNDNIPTFNEVLKKTEYEGFKTILKRQLKSGVYGKGTDNKSPEHHKQMNLDNNTKSTNGKTNFEKTEINKHDAIRATAQKDTDYQLSKFKP